MERHGIGQLHGLRVARDFARFAHHVEYFYSTPLAKRGRRAQERDPRFADQAPPLVRLLAPFLAAAAERLATPVRTARNSSKYHRVMGVSSLLVAGILAP